MIDDLKINLGAIEVCKTLQMHGFKAYIVGGCVRDLIMGIVPHDWDITTNALPDKVMELFPKNYATGLQHGTVTVGLNDEHFEVTTFRVEGEYTDGRRPDEVIFVQTIEEDLGRRDLTINAIAYDPINKDLVDPYLGILHIKTGIIKAVYDEHKINSHGAGGQASDRFLEDGLRIMRVARFASRFKFEVEYWTMKDMCHARQTLEKISKERIHDELVKTLATDMPSCGLDLLHKTFVLKTISPIIADLREKDHYLFVDLDGLPPEVEVETKMAFILEEVEKPEEELKRLKFSNQEIKKITFLHDTYQRFLNHEKSLKMDSGYFARKFLSLIKNQNPDTYENSIKQVLYFAELHCTRHREKIEEILDHQVWSRKELVISGEDVLATGLMAGPVVKSVLDQAYDQILKYPNDNNRDYMLSWLDSLVIEIKNFKV